MSGGEVVFNAADGYDADMWDDSMLIRNYEKALEASRRELMRRRKEGGKKKKNWSLGDACRVLHSVDGFEYEGTIVNLSARSATVRLHGYNEELDVGLGDVEESLGQHEIQNQIEQANLEGFEEKEEPFTGELREGSFCRARWSLDEVVYEGVINAVDKARNQVRVKFVGYLNEDTVDIDQLYKSKGEEWREQQEIDSKCDIAAQDLSETLDTFMHQIPEVLQQIPSLENLSLEERAQPTINNEKTKHKIEKKKSKKSKKEKEKISSQFTDATRLKEFPSSFELPDPLSFLPGVQCSGVPVGTGGGADEERRIEPPPLPQPPSNETHGQHSQALHSMLLSWYMAGYHTGYFQAVTNQKRPGKSANETVKRSKIS